MIGDNIYTIRKKRGLTLSELAERASISKSYLSNIERNVNQNPSIQVLEKLSIVLDVNLSTLLSIELKVEQPVLEKEWISFINELKKSGVEKEQIGEFKTLIDFIKWQKQNTIKG